MILMLPFLLITLHFSQMGFTDDLTFMVNPPFTFVSAFLGAGIDILIPARKSTDKIIIRGNANCKQNFQKQFRHQKNEKADCAGLLAAGRFFILKEGADAPEAAAGSCVSSEQPAAPAGCGLMAELSKSQQKSRKRTDTECPAKEGDNSSPLWYDKNKNESEGFYVLYTGKRADPAHG